MPNNKRKKVRAHRSKRRVVGQVQSFPDRKLSEAFLKFAQPLLEAFPDATEAELEGPLQIAFTVWNAVVAADAVGNHQFLDILLGSSRHDPEIAAVMRYLVDRKRTLFGDDHRLVGEYKFYRQNGELRFRADGHDPRRRV